MCVCEREIEILGSIQVPTDGTCMQEDVFRKHKTQIKAGGDYPEEYSYDMHHFTDSDNQREMQNELYKSDYTIFNIFVLFLYFVIIQIWLSNLTQLRF